MCVCVLLVKRSVGEYYYIIDGIIVDQILYYIRSRIHTLTLFMNVYFMIIITDILIYICNNGILILEFIDVENCTFISAISNGI